MKNKDYKRFMRYCLVGVIGFCTDAGILQLGIHFLDLGPIQARVPSFLTAVFVTWYLNRGFTFRMKKISFRKSFPAYIVANTVGFGINFGTYSAGVLLSPLLARLPLIPLAIGAGIALIFNFIAAKYIFQDQPEEEVG